MWYSWVWLDRVWYSWVLLDQVWVWLDRVWMWLDRVWYSCILTGQGVVLLAVVLIGMGVADYHIMDAIVTLG